MNQQPVKVSVVVPTFRPGESLDRVVRSLDAQTLPQDEFEVIYVDDGSGDGTVERLRQIAADRPNVRVAESEHSGWSGRPRNLGTDLARGEYVLFMDHDDSLYPDGLRRSHEYARETGADIVSPKESKTNDVWWGLSPGVEGNIANLRSDGGIARLIPMVPHKLYRRSLLVEHGVRFPESARALWEDWYINLGAYRHAEVVSLLADSPVYLWHASDHNTTRTFDPMQEDYWDRLGDVLDFAAATFDQPADRDTLETVLAHKLRLRVLDRCVRVVTSKKADDGTIRMVVARARELLTRIGSDAVLARMSRKDQIQIGLLRGGRPDLMAAFHAAEMSLSAHVTARSPRWDGRVLRFDTELRWAPRGPGDPALRMRDGRVIRRVSTDLERAIPPELLDVTDPAGGLGLRVALRDRLAHVSWPLPTTVGDPTYVVDDAGALCLVQHGQAAVALDEAALGAPLARSVWDLHVRADWDGMVRGGALTYRGHPRPALSAAGSAVAYANQGRGLTLDLAGRTRTLVTDAAPRHGHAGPAADFCTPVENLDIAAGTTVDVDDVVAIPEGAVPRGLSPARQGELLEELGAASRLTVRLTEQNGRGFLRGSAALSQGSYVLYGRRGGTLRRTRCTLRVDETGQAHFGTRR